MNEDQKLSPASMPPEASRGNSSQGDDGSGAGRFDVLDGMRGLAALFVVTDHAASTTLQALMPYRAMAVDFFFVLSGFVLAHAYGARLQRGMSPISFLRIRLIRLYPLYLLGLFIGAVFVLRNVAGGYSTFTSGDVGYVIGFGLLMLPTPPGVTARIDAGDPLYPLNGPCWSIFFELGANFFYALIARFLTWRIFAVLLPATAIALAFTIFSHDELMNGWLWGGFDYGLARVAYGFFAGVFIYKTQSACKIPSLPAWLCFALLLGLVCMQVPAGWARPAYAVMSIVLVPVLVLISARATVRGSAAWICGALGTLSYGFYVLHVPLMLVTDFERTARFGVEWPFGFVHVIQTIVVALVAATVANRFYDKPIRRWLTKLTARRATMAL